MGLFNRRRPGSRKQGGAKTPAPALAIDPCAHDLAAVDLREALLRHDHAWAAEFLTAVTEPDERAFYLSICARVPGLQDWIGAWTRAEPRSTLPLLVRGAHAVGWAWAARQGTYNEQDTQDDRFQGFSERLELAEACLGEVAARDPGETAAWTFLLAAALGGRVKPDEAHRRFDRVLELHPGHLRAHTYMFTYLCEKWYGSHEEMFAFARGAVAQSPPGSPLGRLVADAHVEVWLSLPKAQAETYMAQEDVRSDLRAAADHSIRHPAYRAQAGWPEVHNVFAFAFALAGDIPAAREEFQIIGEYVTELPWAYYAPDPVDAFSALRERVTAGL
ncbi:hypothetical protein [Actinomadura sp. 9N407]|uniref:hypothetical protein n=1 Tax=Actinomadura sp. 9N407 TaxID=3375154 RepID=UPI0037AE4E7E